jgi:Fe2+ or Zn2+ uptake regulation protein
MDNHGKKKTWVDTVYHIIKEEKKEIDLQTIYERVQKSKKLTPKDLERTFCQTRFHHTVRATLRNLSKKGLIVRVDLGIYKLK